MLYPIPCHLNITFLSLDATLKFHSELYNGYFLSSRHPNLPRLCIPIIRENINEVANLGAQSIPREIVHMDIHPTLEKED